MNVVIVNDFGHVNGGVAQVALASARALAGRGHAVTLLTAVPAAAGDIEQECLVHVCTRQHEIATDPYRLRAAVQGLWNVRARRSMAAVLQQLDPERTVVHFHGWTKALSSSVIAESQSRGYRCVATLHDYFSACPNGGFYNYQQQAHCTLAPLSAACVATHCDARSYPQKLWRVARQLVQRNAGNFPDRMRDFICITDFSAAILKRYLPKGARLHRVRNPVDVAKEAPAAVGDHGRFICVGRLSPEKGGLLLAQACDAARTPLTFVGDGPLRSAILERYPACEMTGWLAPGAVRSQMRRSRALVLPSLWYETQGLVVDEAAALGVPSIVPDTCAATESVVDGVTGLWFRSGDAVDLQQKLQRLSADPALAAALGQAAFERFWQAPPTLQQHVLALESVYRQLLARA